MRCRSCDSPRASWQTQWEEYYCAECLEEIYETLEEDEEDTILEEIYYDD